MKAITKITQKEYEKLMMVLFYRNPIFIFFAFTGFLLIIAFLLDIKPENTAKPYYYLLFAFFFLVVNPLVFLYSMKKQLKNNQEMMETIIYEVENNDVLKVTGESFDYQIKIENIYKVIEFKNWFLIYQDKKNLNIIPKKNMDENFQNFFRNLKK